MARSLGWYLPEQMILKATLAGSEPKIWRRLEVHSGLTLYELHVVMQYAFDWQDAHLYQFHVPPGGKLTRAAMRDALRYHTMPADPMFDDPEDKSGRADEAMLGRVFTDQCKQIVYEYDFGDSWEHVIKLEKRTRGGDQSHVPQCLAGENAAPPEDVGGIYGYYYRLEALRDKNHDAHEETVEWMGEDFDPARFDVEAVNKQLARAFIPVPRKPRRKRKGK
jgi:hypothetical protein